jgi:uncharacterized iron-regulated membrane protein
MDRLVAILVGVLIVVVLLLGFLTWRADDHARDAATTAHDDAVRIACINKAQATATVALLAPAAEVDVEGRRAAIAELGTQLDAC